MKNIFPLFLLFVVFACKSPDARKPVSKSSGQFIKHSIELNKKIQARQEKRIQKIIQQDSSHTYHISPNGFWYRYDKKNKKDTLTPNYGDLVNFNYDISTLEGKPIYTQKQIGTREYVIDKEAVFTGLRQGLKLMKKGETITFLFPSYKAFGFYGDTKKIKHNIPIKSTITLNSIKIHNDSITEQSLK